MFGAQDFGDFITRMDLLKRILAQDSELITEVQRQKVEIEALAVQLEADRKVQAEQARFAEKAKQFRLKKVAEQQELIERMENDRAVYNQRYDEMLAASKEVARLIQESKLKAAAEAAAREQAAAERAARAERERIAREQRLAQERAMREQQRREREQERADRKSGGDVQIFAPEGTGEMMYPLIGQVTSQYGWRTHPIFGGSKFHSGIDIAGETGAPIKAARGGVVTHSGWIDGYGNTVMIDHGGGLVTLYGHNQSVAVSVGQKVKQGQVIAYCGSTGNSTGPHCHFEVRLNGEPVSPYDYL
ncbi:MAG: peptidoglycan DD-metalloendopeptidase family protein [Selenomonadaceae bacterium]|nr:peptidoglycan DD-metalloendopeptidase family protein [Selenomonadaceae bacterium]